MVAGKNPFVDLSNAMVEAVERAGSSIVMVDARRRLPASGIAFADELVITADHVVERDEDIRVLLADGTTVEAKIAGRDPGTDLAVLQLLSGALNPAEYAKKQPQVGQFVLALGRPSLDGVQASLGVVSAIGGPIRTGRGGLLERYLRTDAIPYPGFSGGPLVDAAGFVVGLNTSGLAHGASIAIPAANVWHIAATLAESGHIRRGYLGVRSQTVSIAPVQQETLGRKQSTGLLLVNIESDSPAERGGLLVGDILTGIGSHPVPDPDELLARLVGDVVGKSIPIELLRGGKKHIEHITIGERT